MSALAERPLLYAARPTLTIDGSERPDVAAGLTTMTVRETVDGMFCLEACFGNWGTAGGDIGFLYFDRQLFDFGTEIEVAMGGGQAEGQIFAGRITGIEGRFPTTKPPEIAVLAEDRFQDLRMTRRTRSFSDTNIQSVAEQLAGDHGLQSDVDVEEVSYAVLTQLNQSDLAFLRQLMRTVDGELWIENGTLNAKGRSRRAAAGSLELVYGQTLQEFSVLADLAHQRTSIAVSGWDVSAKSTIDEVADANALGSELGSLTSGASVLSASGLGERKDRVVHHMPLTTSEATAEARSRYRVAARRFVHGHAVAEGDARIRVGAVVNLRELGPLFNGDYYVCEVTHTFEQTHGFRTAFAVERTGIGGP